MWHAWRLFIRPPNIITWKQIVTHVQSKPADLSSSCSMMFQRKKYNKYTSKYSLLVDKLFEKNGMLLVNAWATQKLIVSLLSSHSNRSTGRHRSSFPSYPHPSRSRITDSFEFYAITVSGNKSVIGSGSWRLKYHLDFGVICHRPQRVKHS